MKLLDSICMSAKKSAEFSELIDQLIDQKNYDNILDELAKWFGVSVEQIKGSNRKRAIVDVRDLVAYILRQYVGLSYPVIGRILGGRDHTTIMHAYSKIERRLKNDDDFKEKFPHLILQARETKTKKEKRDDVEQPPYPTKQRDFVKEVSTTYSKFKESVKESQTYSRKLTQRDCRKLTQREEDMYELYCSGFSLNEIGQSYHVTRERVRQIIRKGLSQKATNYLVQNGVVLDEDILYSEAKKQNIQNRYPKKVKPSAKDKGPKKWSRFYIECQKCGTTSVPHFKKGLCNKCGGRSVIGKERATILERCGYKCDRCDISEKEAKIEHSKGLYISREDNTVLCRKCFLKKVSKKMGNYKKYEWSRFYPKCGGCGTTTVPHQAKGFCEECYSYPTKEQREKMIEKLGGHCQLCGMSRSESLERNDMDLYINAKQQLLCRSCFMSIRGNSR